MGLDSYIKVYDDVLGVEQISSIIKWSNKLKFKSGGVSDKQIINKNIRDVELYDIHDVSNESHTRVHWRNYLTALIVNLIKNDYEKSLIATPNDGTGFTGIGELSLLKYGKGGHYNFHIDQFTQAPRILSIIIILNDDYIGGELVFCDNLTKKEIKKIKNKSGKVIIWPSCFMFPHQIKEITEGTRYSIVAWAY